MSEDSLIGKQLGEYLLEALLGQGGMARVYRAVDVRLKRRAVVKVIDPPFRNDPDYVMRFEREAQAISQLDHPNIVKLFRFDEQDGWLYMAMQYVEGTDLGVTLANYRAEKKYIEPEHVSRIIREICLALDYAHSKGVIHRDIKPANILMDKNGHAILSDFGLVLLTEVGTSGQVLGSAHYLAPEQAVSSANVVPQSDLYSVGVILYEMFTWDVPFKADQPLDIIIQHMSETLPPPSTLRPDLSPEVEAVIIKALAKEPGDRYPSGVELSAALDHSLKIGPPPIPVAPPAATPPETPAEIHPHPRPLPRIPAAVAAQPAPVLVEKTESLEQQPVPPVSRKPWMYIGATLGAIALVVLLLCITLVMLQPLMNRLNRVPTANTISNPNVTTQPIILQTTQTATRAKVPVKKPTPSATAAQNYQLQIVRGAGGESLFVINLSENSFPLAGLRLQEGKKILTGAMWGVDHLEKNQCVGIWKSEGHVPPMPSEAGQCQMVGTLQIKKKDLPGDGILSIAYNGKAVGTCNKGQPQCIIQISAQAAKP